MSPQVGRILAQARAGLGFGLVARRRTSVEAANEVMLMNFEGNEPREITGHIGPDRRRSRERSAGTRPPFASEYKTRGNAVGGGGAEGGWGGHASDMKSVANVSAAGGKMQRRLALVSPLVNASAPLADISFGKAGWKTKAAGGGGLQRDTKTGVVGGKAEAQRPLSAMERDRSLAKDAVLGTLYLHVCPCAKA